MLDALSLVLCYVDTANVESTKVLVGCYAERGGGKDGTANPKY